MDIFGNRISELEELILKHKQLYYLGSAQISDEEYDRLEDELRLLSPQNPVLRQVGHQLSDGEKLKHRIPMLSLEKSRTLIGVVEWQNQQEILATYKMDGSSCSVVYESLQFVLAKTRGDGEFGENITKGFNHLAFSKKLETENLPANLEIRGEVVISRENFEKLSSEMGRRGLEKPKSVRNVVAGLLRRKDDLDLCRFLDFIAYEIISESEISGVQTEAEKIQLLQKLGMQVPQFKLLQNSEMVEDFIEDYKTAKENLPYLTDGIVFAVNNLFDQKQRGFTNHHPKGKLAFKLQADSAVTMVKDIEIAVKRSGKVSFIGIVEPVELAEATISRVSLHNMNYILENEINIGSLIEIVRSNEVIPKHQKTLQTNGVYTMPVVCPECKNDLIKSDSGVDLICNNPDCSSMNFYKLLHWVDVVNIEDFSEKSLEKLYDDGIVKSIADLYRLRIAQVLTMDGYKEKSAAKLIKNIDKRRKIDFTTFLTAVSISGMGFSIAGLITEVYPDLSSLSVVTKIDLLQIKGIGEVLADNLLNSLNYLKNVQDELQSVGVEIVPAEVVDRSALLWFGKNFVITGTLNRPRKEIVVYIETLGGKVTDAVSANTHYLVANVASGSSKFKKAKELNIPLISEEKLFSGVIDE